MSADVPHFGRPGTSTMVHRGDFDHHDVAYPAAAVDFSHGGSGSSSDMDWDLAADDGGGDFLDGLAAGTGNTGSAGGGELCFDDFLDLEGMSSGTGDELTDVLPDSFYFELGPVDGSASTTSASDDLDDLFSCHSSQQQQPLYHGPPSMGARPSATADSAATFSLAPPGGPGGSGDFLSVHHQAGVQSSSAIARPPREQRSAQASTYPAAPLGPGAPESISDSELLRLEGISLKASPSRPPPPPTPHPLGTVSLSQHPTPHPRQGREGPATTTTISDQQQPHPTATTTTNTNTTTTASAATNTAASAAARRPATTTTSTSTASSTTTSFFKAVASKIQQKAATVRSSKASSSSHRRTATAATNDPSQDYNQSNMSTVAIGRPISPATSLPKAIKLEPTQHHQMAMTADPRLPISPPNSATIPQGMSANFGSGMLEDPFGGVPVNQVHGMYRRSNPHTPLDTPIMDDDKAEMYFSPTTTHMGGHESGPVSQTSKAAWPSSQSDSQGAIAWANSFAQPDGSIDGAHWWDSSVDVNAVNAHFQAQNARNASYNLALHVHPDGPDMSYGAYGTPHIPVSAGPDMSGMMMGMPSGPHHSRSSSSPVVHNAYTHLPPQHHMQQQQQHPHPGSQTERRPRMPRAPSAGTRHLQTPMRRQRPPSRTRRDSSSVSPTPQARSRNSSGSSVVGGPVMASSIKKRRSFNATTARHHIRTASNGSAVGLGIDLSNNGGGGGGGFVNFTPSDKNVLMTGVAPSGSSKTKARREKEAQEKRRRMSEAAIKAVRDAGGDIDKLMEEGFTTY
ncbi:hypothetical protein F5X68DRAFT_239019 [Plectosphaerella plurivora]|uniref:Developmental regulatory protein wetA n=1 Tax=Plectosphaerella plurivora TaxID=936078 RepID=A0A9P8VPX9_9PEZI|nr:hypothetical protein F5X68DRAFT_239019 [Plectosphaerella plurivora]